MLLVNFLWQPIASSWDLRLVWAPTLKISRNLGYKMRSEKVLRPKSHLVVTRIHWPLHFGRLGRWGRDPYMKSQQETMSTYDWEKLLETWRWDGHELPSIALEIKARARGCVCVGATWAAMASPSHVFGDNTAEDLKTAESFGMG